MVSMTKSTTKSCFNDLFLGQGLNGFYDKVNYKVLF